MSQVIASIALFEPDIPQNLGAIMRLCACFGMPLHIIEPCGFPLDDARMRRVGMDYIHLVELHKHASWDQFYAWIEANQKRLLLLTTKSDYSYTSVTFTPQDVLLFGRESAGAPDYVHSAVHERITVPMHGAARSLNLAMSAAIVAGEVSRQLSI